MPPLCRCLPLWIPSLGGFEALAHLAAVLNGIAGPIAMSAPITVSGLSAVCRAHPGLIITRTLQISAAWFPPEERTRATSIGQMCNALGVGVSYLLAMAIVTSGDAGDSDAGETSCYIPQIERSAEG